MTTQNPTQSTQVTTKQPTTKPATTKPTTKPTTKAPPTGDCDQVRLKGPYPEANDYDGIYIKTGWDLRADWVRFATIWTDGLRQFVDP